MNGTSGGGGSDLSSIGPNQSASQIGVDGGAGAGGGGGGMNGWADG